MSRSASPTTHPHRQGRASGQQLELEFAAKLSALDALSGRLAEQPMSSEAGTGTSSDGTSKPCDTLAAQAEAKMAARLAHSRHS